MLPVPDTFAYLIGTWTVDRLYRDHVSGTEGRFTGTAVVQPLLETEPGERRASYYESGNLEFGTHRGPAVRRLTLTTTSSSQIVQLWFTDGSPFVELDLRTGAWISEHPCRSDLYELRSEVETENSWREQWRVRGSSKDYEARAQMTRQTPEPPLPMRSPRPGRSPA